MNNFELTERGKIVIAVVIVVVLLVIPLVIILGISSCNDSPASPPDSGITTVIPPQSPTIEEETPEISSTPLPADDNGDNAADENTEQEPEPTAEPEQTPTPEPPSESEDPEEEPGKDEPLEYGPVGLDKTAGTMSFITTDLKTLDEETVEMLEDFLTSPKNTGGATIKIEMPNLSDADELVFKAAVAEAFASYNIPESRLLYVSGSGAEISEQRFEVALSFTPISNQK